jgi:hypothetical protein
MWSPLSERMTSPCPSQRFHLQILPVLHTAAQTTHLQDAAVVGQVNIGALALQQRQAALGVVGTLAEGLQLRRRLLSQAKAVCVCVVRTRDSARIGRWQSEEETCCVSIGRQRVGPRPQATLLAALCAAAAGVHGGAHSRRVDAAPVRSGHDGQGGGCGEGGTANGSRAVAGDDAAFRPCRSQRPRRGSAPTSRRASRRAGGLQRCDEAGIASVGRRRPRCAREQLPRCAERHYKSAPRACICSAGHCCNAVPSRQSRSQTAARQPAFCHPQRGAGAASAAARRSASCFPHHLLPLKSIVTVSMPHPRRASTARTAHGR